MAYMFDRKPLNHPQIRLCVRSLAPGLRNFSVITFHCLGPFPYKNALKKRTQSKSLRKEGIPLTTMTNSPSFSPVQKMAERSKAKRSLGWERNQDGGQQYGQASTGITYFWTKTHAFRCPNTVHRIFKRMAYLFVFKRMAWKVWRALACYKRTFISILVSKRSFILIKQSIYS